MRRARVVSVVASVAVVIAVSSTSRVRADDAFEPVASGFDFAVNLAFAPDGRVFVADRTTGEIRVIDDGRLLAEPFATLPVDASSTETGLLGLAVGPRFGRDGIVDAYYSDRDTGTNRLVGVALGGPVESIYGGIETTAIHNGGDLAFANDGSLFLVTGDGGVDSRAQDPSDPHGKVLAFDTLEGGATPRVYALGIRNSFGLCVDRPTGDLWETENGPSEWDEVNEIDEGSNHGWPTQLGPGGGDRFVEPVYASRTIIVPTGCVARPATDGVWFGDFHGDLHRLTLDGGRVSQTVVASFREGITDVASAPDGSLWVATPSTVYRATPSFGASPSPDAGIGGALGSAGGLLVLAALAGAFMWLRSRTLRR
jgi:glucose/arabinose dehydrogenase